MLPSVDFFYYSLGIGFLVLTGFACYALYNLALTLKTLKQVADDVAETTQDINSLKNGIKTGAIKIAMNLLNRFTKGGDN